MTTATETKVLTAGNDTVDGSVANSLNNDIIVDSSTADTDVLNAAITANATATITNVETSNIDFKGFNLTFNAATVTGGKIVASTTQEFNTSATITNLSNKGVNVDVGTGITTLVLGGSAATSDATTVKLAGGNLALTTTSGNTLETVGINSTGSAANVVTLTNATATGETFNITGDKSVTLKVAQANITGDTVTKALTGGATSTVEITTTNASLDLKNVAADTFAIAAAGNTAFGTNAVIFAAGTTNLEVNQAGILDNVSAVLTANGTATTDVLNLKLNKSGTTDILATAGFETVNITNNTGADVALTAAIHTFGVSGNAKLFGSNNFNFNTTGIVAQGVDASAMTGTGALTVVVANNATNDVTVKGTANADSITLQQTTAKLVTVDAGNGNNTVTGAAAATAGLSITTGTGNDTITSGIGNDTIQSGAGNDTVTVTATAGGTGNNIIITGDGNDTLNMALGTGAIFANAGAGDDAVSVGANLTVTDTVVGGSGNDALAISEDTATTDLDNVSGFETLNITQTAGASSYTTKDTLVEAGATLTVNHLAAFGLTFNGAAETDGKFVISTFAGAGNHVLTGGAGADTFTIAGSGTANITGGKGADSIVLTGTAVQTITQAKGDSLVVTAITAGMSTVGADVVSGAALAATDIINTGNANIVTAKLNNNVTANPVTLANDSAYFIEGAYDATTKAFTAGTYSNATLLVYDADSTSGTQFEAVVLVGIDTGTNTVATGTITLA